MKIAMLGHKHVPSREGGIEVVVEELATRMVQEGHAVTCYNRKGNYIYDQEAKNTPLQGTYQGIVLKQVFTIQKKGFAALSAAFSAALCASFSSYDIVHFHAEGPCAMLWIPKLFGKRCIATIHGLDHKRGKWNKLSRACILFGEKVAAKCADEIIVLSQNTKEYFQETYQRDTVYIPNAAQQPVLRAANEITAQFGLEKDSYFLYLGRIVPEKGLHYLIPAFKALQTDKKLVVAGFPSDTTQYFETVQKLAQGDDRIIFTGFVQGEVQAELYSNAYAYVMPSDVEGMSLTLLEAMSYGNCCIVSDIPECTEVVQNNGIVFAKGDIAALQQALQEAIVNTAATAAYKAAAAEYICQKYNWEDITAQTLALYRGAPAVQPVPKAEVMA